MTLRLLTLVLCVIAQSVLAQPDTTNYSKRRDLIDVAEKFLGKPLIDRDTIKKKSGRIYFSGSPSVGYF